MTRLIAARDPETGAPLADAVIHDNLVTFIGAGHETTANALAWTLFLLSEFPDADARVAAEARRLDGVPGADELARARRHAHDPRRVDAALSAGAVHEPRARSARDRIGEVTVAPGTRIIIAPWVLHRHRKLWPDADLFVPERFAPARRGDDPALCLSAVRRGRAHLRRHDVRHAGGAARADHDRAALPRARWPKARR